MRFNRRMRLEFHGAMVASDGVLLAYGNCSRIELMLGFHSCMLFPWFDGICVYGGIHLDVGGYGSCDTTGS